MQAKPTFGSGSFMQQHEPRDTNADTIFRQLPTRHVHAGDMFGNLESIVVN